jgi:hypothetical protein
LLRHLYLKTRVSSVQFSTQSGRLLELIYPTLKTEPPIDMKLDTLLKETGSRSLSGYLRNQKK